ncbi:uncharacterized protein LOC143363630 [Halictus rubicundus]|uniref:uncharacterized protein LOC143363630 n=1 Tax=Halictus rubicundus TaxID=77578 RepID=UPI004035432D
MSTSSNEGRDAVCESTAFSRPTRLEFQDSMRVVLKARKERVQHKKPSGSAARYVNPWEKAEGANNEVTELSRVLNENEKIRQFLDDKEISWHFMPALIPHFGGLWKAAVKSFKHHLKRVVGNELFTYEEFATFVTEIEAVLNSLPLTPISSDPNDPEALTPGHFLIGTALTSIPEVDLTMTSNNKLSKWQHIQKVKQDFWTRWSKEYINQLNVRAKWAKGSHIITKGTIVVLKDNHLPPSHWNLGRVEEIHPGPDDVIRAVTIRTINGVYKRNVKQLAPLLIEPTSS